MFIGKVAGRRAARTDCRECAAEPAGAGFPFADAARRRRKTGSPSEPSWQDRRRSRHTLDEGDEGRSGIEEHTPGFHQAGQPAMPLAVMSNAGLWCRPGWQRCVLDDAEGQQPAGRPQVKSGGHRAPRHGERERTSRKAERCVGREVDEQRPAAQDRDHNPASWRCWIRSRRRSANSCRTRWPTVAKSIGMSRNDSPLDSSVKGRFALLAAMYLPPPQSLSSVSVGPRKDHVGHPLAQRRDGCSGR